MGYTSLSKSVTWSGPSRACFSVVKYKTEVKKNHKQVATDGSFSKDLAEHLKGGNTAFWVYPWVLGFGQSLIANDFHPSIKTNLGLSIYFCTSKNGGLNICIYENGFNSLTVNAILLLNVWNQSWKSASWLFNLKFIMVVYRGKIKKKNSIFIQQSLDLTLDYYSIM